MGNFFQTLIPAIQANPAQALNLIDKALTIIQDIVTVAKADPQFLNTLAGLFKRN